MRIKMTIDIEVDSENFPLFPTAYQMREIFNTIKDKHSTAIMRIKDFDWKPVNNEGVK